MTRARTTRRVGVVVLTILVVVALLPVGVVASFAGRAAPQVSGTVQLPGMTDEVTIRRDGSGVPHLTGTVFTDLARAQGYVHAQDRFFDMDLRRHVATGTLSELVGEAGLRTDRVVRTLGWRQVAEESLPMLRPETRRYLQAYADGVNDYLRSRSKNRLALEYVFLGIQQPGYAVADWTPVDSLAWLTAMAWDLRGNYTDELTRARLTGRVDPTQVIQYYPAYDPAVRAPILGPEAWRPGAVAPGSPSATTPTAAAPGAGPAAAPAVASPPPGEWYAAIAAELDGIPSLHGRGEGVGSNSWVVSGAHTASGKPLLANDPHLGVRLPGTWYQNSLTCLELTSECPIRVSGFSFPGLPGVVIGHNDRIAWAFTNLGPDVTDFYLEHLDAEGRVQRGGEYVALTTRTETIRIAGGGTETLTVRSTSHGPLVSDVVPAAADAGAHAPTFGRDDGGHVYGLSLAWTGLQASTTADAVIGLNRARSFEEFRAALRDFAVPSQNVLYADVDGHIGYQAPGRIPVRRPVADGEVPGFWPAPGWDPSFAWSGTVPFEELPFALDPPSGVLVAANQAVTASPLPFLTSEWDPGYRSQRIADLLAQAPPGSLTAPAMAELQLDSLDPFAPVLVGALRDVDLRDDPFTAQARDLLLEWDHTQPASGPGAAAAAYYNAVWAQLVRLTFDDEVPEDLAASGGARHRAVVTELLADPTNAWWDDERTPGVTEERTEILRQALVNARADLTRRLGKDPSGWRWGDLHTWTPTHPVLGGESVPAPARALFNAGPVELAGGSSVVNANGWDASRGFEVTWAPSMRMVVDLADLDRSVWINQTGVSGHRWSDHYTDQLADWAAGRVRAWPFSEAAVAAATEDTLVLAPSAHATGRRD